MEISVSLLEDGKIEANLGALKIIAQEHGDKKNYPEPYDYFEASTVLCAAFYVRTFLEKRNISTDGLAISQVSCASADNKYKKELTLKVKLPTDFPEKYRKAILVAIKNCTVKKVVQSGPEFKVEIE